MENLDKLTNQELQDKLVNLDKYISMAVLSEPELPKMEKEYALAIKEMERRVFSWRPSQIFASVVLAQKLKEKK